MVQLPGIAAQGLMAEGYGFAGEGNWKTAALVRAMKVMANGLPEPSHRTPGKFRRNGRNRISDNRKRDQYHKY